MIKSKDYTIIVIMIYLRYLRLELVWFASWAAPLFTRTD